MGNYFIADIVSKNLFFGTMTTKMSPIATKFVAAMEGLFTKHANYYLKYVLPLFRIDGDLATTSVRIFCREGRML